MSGWRSNRSTIRRGSDVIRAPSHSAAPAHDSDQPLAGQTGRAPLSVRLREALLRVAAFYWDGPVTLARLLRRIGLKRVGVRLLSLAFDVNPWDAALGAALCNMSYELGESACPPGTMARATFIMRALARSYPSERVSAAYFANLEAMLDQRERRGEPGTLVLGLGAGRVGSTTLTSIVAANKAVIATHENPPFVWWQPHRRQIEFHKRRFHLLLHHAPVVFDAAYWWLNVLEEFFAEFPSSKAIGLVRDIDATVRSFASLPAAHECGHVEPHNGLWNQTRWSATHPAYAPPPGARADRGAAKQALIRRYVAEYNQRLATLAAGTPERLLLVATEELDSATTRRKIGEFIGLPVSESVIRLNVGSTADALHHSEWF